MNRWLIGLTLTTLLSFTVAIRWPRVAQPPTEPRQVVSELLQQLTIEPHALEPPATSPVVLTSDAAVPTWQDIPKRFLLRGTTSDHEPLALIEDRASHRLGTYRVGDRLLDATLVTIGRGVVWLAQGARRIPLWLTDFEESTPPHDTGAVTLRTMTLTPAVDANNRMSGLKLKTLSSDSPLRRLGLQSDDVIVSVNGQRLTSPQKTLAVLRRALLQPAVTVQIDRAGSLHELRLHQ